MEQQIKVFLSLSFPLSLPPFLSLSLKSINRFFLKRTLRNSAPKSTVMWVLSPCVPVKIFIINVTTRTDILLNRYDNIIASIHKHLKPCATYRERHLECREGGKAMALSDFPPKSNLKNFSASLLQGEIVLSIDSFIFCWSTQPCEQLIKLSLSLCKRVPAMYLSFSSNFKTALFANAIIG